MVEVDALLPTAIHCYYQLLALYCSSGIAYVRICHKHAHGLWSTVRRVAEQFLSLFAIFFHPPRRCTLAQLCHLHNFLDGIQLLLYI